MIRASCRTRKRAIKSAGVFCRDATGAPLNRGGPRGATAGFACLVTFLVIAASLIVPGCAGSGRTETVDGNGEATPPLPLDKVVPVEQPAAGSAKSSVPVPPTKLGLGTPIGQVVVVDTWQVVVNDVRVDESLQSLKGGRFVVVDWTIKNSSSQGAYIEIGPPDPNRLTLLLRDPTGRESLGWFYNQVGSGYGFIAAPGDVMRTQFYFPIGGGSLEGVQLVMQFPRELSQEAHHFELGTQASRPAELLPSSDTDAPGIGQRVVVAERWAFTLHGVELSAGADGAERIVKVDLTAENLQQQPRVFAVTERDGSAERRDFYLMDQHGYIAYSRGDQMPAMEIDPGESRRVTLWLYTHDLAPHGRYRLSLIVDWQANQYASFEFSAGGSQAAR